MTARAIDPAGQAGAAASAAPLIRRWRALLGALLLTLTPGLASAATEEWPTTPDRGPGTETRIPWLRFSGDPNAPAQVLGEVGRGREVVVLREQPPSARQRRLLRRAERHADKAAKLRERAGAGQSAYAVVVPVVRPAAPAIPRTVVIDQRRPQVQVVHHARDEGCEEREAHARIEAREVEDVAQVHAPVVIDAERLARAVERDVAREMERAHREVERAAARMQRDAERAQREGERAQRDGERAQRDTERVQREVERAHREAERAARAGVKAAERALRDAKKATKRGG